MKFFFPDSQDQINPDFDFVTEEHLALRVRQRDDLYAHEVLDGHVIDGLLVSKAIVDGTAGSAGKYTAAQTEPAVPGRRPALLPARSDVQLPQFRRWETAAPSATSTRKSRQ